MELRVWVAGLQRVVQGVTSDTSCQEVIYALAHATGQTGRFVLVEQWRSSERSLSPSDRPLELLTKWGEYSADVKFVLKQLENRPFNSFILSNSKSATLKPSTPHPYPTDSLKRRQAEAEFLPSPLPTIVAEAKNRTSLSVMAQSMQSALESNMEAQAHNLTQSSIVSTDSASSRGRALPSYNYWARQRAATPNPLPKQRSASAKRPPPPAYEQVFGSSTPSPPSYKWPASRDELERLVGDQKESMEHQMRTIEALDETHTQWIEQDRTLARQLDQMLREISHLEAEQENLQSSLCNASSPESHASDLDAALRATHQAMTSLKPRVAHIDNELAKTKAEESHLQAAIALLTEQITGGLESENEDPEISKEIEQLENSIRLKRQKLGELFGKMGGTENDDGAEGKKAPGVWV